MNPYYGFHPDMRLFRGGDGPAYTIDDHWYESPLSMPSEPNGFVRLRPEDGRFFYADGDWLNYQLGTTTGSSKTVASTSGTGTVTATSNSSSVGEQILAIPAVGDAAVIQAGAAGTTSGVQITLSSEFDCVWYFRTGNIISDNTNVFTTRAGLFNTTTGGSYQVSVAASGNSFGGRWYCRVYNGGTPTDYDTGILPRANTTYRIRIRSTQIWVQYYMQILDDGTREILIGLNNRTNAPASSVALAPGFAISKSAGTSPTGIAVQRWELWKPVRYGSPR